MYFKLKFERKRNGNTTPSNRGRQHRTTERGRENTTREKEEGEPPLYFIFFLNAVQFDLVKCSYIIFTFSSISSTRKCVKKKRDGGTIHKREEEERNTTQ